MNALLDTHALLWFLEGAPGLSNRARELIENEENVCLVSMAAGWEMAIKVTLGKLQTPIPSAIFSPKNWNACISRCSQ